MWSRQGIKDMLGKDCVGRLECLVSGGGGNESVVVVVEGNRQSVRWT